MLFINMFGTLTLTFLNGDMDKQEVFYRFSLFFAATPPAVSPSQVMRTSSCQWLQLKAWSQPCHLSVQPHTRISLHLPISPGTTLVPFLWMFTVATSLSPRSFLLPFVLLPAQQLKGSQAKVGQVTATHPFVNTIQWWHPSLCGMNVSPTKFFQICSPVSPPLLPRLPFASVLGTSASLPTAPRPTERRRHCLRDFCPCCFLCPGSREWHPQPSLFILLELDSLPTNPQLFLCIIFSIALIVF